MDVEGTLPVNTEFCVQCSTSGHLGSHSKIIDALDHLGEALHKDECCDAGDGVVDCLISNCARVSRFRMQKALCCLIGHRFSPHPVSMFWFQRRRCWMGKLPLHWKKKHLENLKSMSVRAATPWLLHGTFFSFQMASPGHQPVSRQATETAMETPYMAHQVHGNFYEILVLHPNQLRFTDISGFLCQEIGSSNIGIQGDASAAKSQKRYRGRKYIVRWIACGAQDWIFSDRWAWSWNCGNWPGWQESWWPLATHLVTSDSGKWYSFPRSDILFGHLYPYRRVFARKRERERKRDLKERTPTFFPGGMFWGKLLVYRTTSPELTVNGSWIGNTQNETRQKTSRYSDSDISGWLVTCNVPAYPHWIANSESTVVWKTSFLVQI